MNRKNKEYSKSYLFKIEEMKMNLSNKLTSIVSSAVHHVDNNYLSSNNRNNQHLQKVAVSIIQAYFNRNENNNQVSNESKNIVESSMKVLNAGILISNPRFYHSNNKVVVNIFYYVNVGRNMNNDNNMESNKVLPLANVLSVLFGKEVHINITRVYYPYMNSIILAQYLVKNAPTNTFLHISEAIVSYPSLSPNTYGKEGEEDSFVLPSYITDIRLELSGRLVTEQQVPRVTKKSSRVSNSNVNAGSSLEESGISSESMNNTVVDYAKYTHKNQLGSFTMKVWITSIQSVSKGVNE